MHYDPERREVCGTELPAVPLTGLMARMLNALIERRGTFVPWEALIWSVYRGAGPENPHNTLTVILFRIRKRFRDAGAPCPVVVRNGHGLMWDA